MTENILKNPGFESGIPNDWKTWNTGTGHKYIYPEAGRTGGSSVAVEYKTKEEDKLASWIQDIQIDVTKKYKLSGYVKTENIIGTGTSIRIFWKDDNQQILGKSTIMTRQTGTVSWKYFEGVVTPSPNSIRATIVLDLKDSSGKVWFDDVSFSAIEVPILSHPNMYLNMDEITAIKTKVQANQEPWKTAYDKLMSTSSDEKYGSMGWAMNLPKQSVTYDGGGHVYKTCDNPPCSPRGDYDAAVKVGKAVRNLGLVYALTGESRYADKAIQLINAWCIDSDTYMEPIQGNFNSRIELSVTMPGMFYGADLIWNYSGWDTDKKNKFVDWVRKLAGDSESWVQDDCYNNYPCKEDGWCQNQEAWRLLFRMSTSVILGDANTRNDAFDKWKKYVDCQISSKGCTKGEVHRTTSLNYSMYAINALIQTAEIARHYGVDLYSYKTSDGRGLEKALDLYAKYVSDPNAPSKWKSECPCGKCQQDGGYDGSTNGNAQVYELAYTFVGNKSIYKQCIERWRRPMNEIRTMGPVTLTHALKLEPGPGPEPGPIPGYHLIWSDEFDGISLDTMKWDIKQTSDGYWRSQNVSTSNGNLILKGEKDNVGAGYHSGYILSKEYFQYGYVEFRAKLMKGNGYNSQLWMEGKKYEGAAHWNGEIDLNEYAGHNPTKCWMNIHWCGNNTYPCDGTYHKQNQKKYPEDTNTDWSKDYHIYACEWTPSYVKFYIDGKLAHTVNVNMPIPQRLIMSLCVSATSGKPCGGSINSDSTTPWPGYMYVDYVRVYQKE